MTDAKTWYDESYAARGFAAQRRYPNEELLRFLGTHYFGIEPAERRGTAILEVGCGSGANLWAIAREGFDAYGLDLSPEALKLARMMLAQWGAEAKFFCGGMDDMPFDPDTFDAVVDVFSSYCLNEAQFSDYLDEAARVLKPGGRYFSFAPSKNSDAFKNFAPSRKLDDSTLDGIQRKTSPYFGNAYPFRFIAPDEYAKALKARGFTVTSNERCGRTYGGGSEYFEFVSIAARKS